MKKRFFLFALVLSLLTLAAGCGNEPQPEQVLNEPPVSTEK